MKEDGSLKSSLESYLAFAEGEFASERNSIAQKRRMMVLHGLILEVFRTKLSKLGNEPELLAVVEGLCKIKRHSNTRRQDSPLDHHLITKLRTYAVQEKAHHLESVVQELMANVTVTHSLEDQQQVCEEVIFPEIEALDSFEGRQQVCQAPPMIPELKRVIDELTVVDTEKEPKVDSSAGACSRNDSCLCVVSYKLKRNDGVLTNCMDFSPDFRYLCCGYDDCSLNLWHLSPTTQNPVSIQQDPPYKLFRIHGGPLFDVKFLNGSESGLLSASTDTFVRLLDFRRG
ncbi:unnamed protein product, partial [Soboliphyme baturini]|uniref:WD_REPEATS_REGION domain-containing protein n=1 Tax=Soboliphyme baturini TaxID=241478 RepID=A0A183J584_9BILA